MTTGGYDNWPETLMRRGWQALTYLAALREQNESLLALHSPLNWAEEDEIHMDAIQIMLECDMYIHELNDNMVSADEFADIYHQASEEDLQLRLHIIMPEPAGGYE